MLLQNSPYSQDGRVRREATTLRRAGYAVTVICPSAEGEPRHVDFDGVRAYQYSPINAGGGLLGYLVEYAYSMVMTLWLSIYVFCRHGFDVVHAHNPPDLFVFIAAFYKLLGRRFIFDHHDLAPEMYFARFSGKGNRFVYNALLFFERLSCCWADHILASNDSYKQLEMERSGIPDYGVTVVRNGPEACHLEAVEPEPSVLRERKTVIGFVGEIGFQDGIDYLLRALRSLKYDLGCSDWECVLVGDGASVKCLRPLAARLGIEEQITVTGWLDYRSVPRYVAAMDICVAPDPSNDYADRSTIIKLMEYMAQAKPIVAFDLPEHRATAGRCALFARPNDEADFAQQIARLMDNPDLGRRLGLAGRQRVIHELAWAHQEHHLLEAYAKVLQIARGTNDIASRHVEASRAGHQERRAAPAIR